jgi:CHAD domain-containing protein
MARSSGSSSSWHVIAGEGMPAGNVAARTLRRRLDAVWSLLPPASREADREPESVHHLRVATRRAIAAINAFRDLIPGRRADWFEKQLRRIRRAARLQQDLASLQDQAAAGARPFDPSELYGADGLPG